MANTVIQLKHSTLTGNVPSSLANGEISINSRDGKFFYSTPAGVIVTHYPYLGPAGLNGEIQFNDSGVLGANSGLTFDKSIGALTVSGNVSTSQYFIGDGSKLTGLAPALQIYSLANTASGVSDYMVLKSLDAYTVGTQNTTTKTVTTTPTILTSFVSDVGFPNITSIPSGDIIVEFDTQKASGVGGYYCYAEIYKRAVGGTETLIATTGNSSSSTLNTQIQQRVNVYISTPVSLVVSDRIVVKIYAVMLTTSASISILFDGAADGALTLPVLPASTLNFVPYINATANVQLNSYSLITQTVSANSVVVLGRNLDAYANAAFLQANTPSHVANSAASYANSAFAAANAATATDATQNTNITNAGTYANSAFGRANTAAVAANTPSATANSAASYANSAFARANNSLDANNGGTVTGTITATSFITTGSFGNITGANTIYANNFVANAGFIQFADGSKQYTANAGSGGGGTTDWGFGIIYTANNNTFANAAAANSQVNFVGESGVVVYANSVTKTITVAGTPGAQGLTVDYGFVNDPTYYSIDYGSLA